MPRLRRPPTAGTFLDGLNVASLALMAVVTLQLGQAAFVDVPTAVVGLIRALLPFRYRVNSTWLVRGSAVVDMAVHAAGLGNWGRLW